MNTDELSKIMELTAPKRQTTFVIKLSDPEDFVIPALDKPKILKSILIDRQWQHSTGPCSCPECGKLFPSFVPLRGHLKDKHNIKVKKPEDILGSKKEVAAEVA